MRVLSILDHRADPPGSRLRVDWFERWEHPLDQALDLLPAPRACSRDLFRVLAATPSPARKRIALVTEGGAPVAIVAVRRRNNHWDLVTEGVIPYAFPPCLPGREIEALAALGLFIWINEWDRPVPDSRHVRFVQYEQVFGVSTRVDFDAFWQEHGNANAVKKARKRCERLGQVELEVDRPGAAQWTVERWQQAWSAHPWSETVATPDILVAIDHLQPQGQYHAFRLLVDGRPVAGLNTFVAGDTLIMANSARDTEFDHAGTGVHLDDLFYRWSATSPYERINLGGGFDYKARWSDPEGVRARFSIAPTHLAVARHGLVVARWVKDRVAHRTREASEQTLAVALPVAGLATLEAMPWA